MKFTKPKNGHYNCYCYECKNWCFVRQVGCAYDGICRAVKDDPTKQDAYDRPCGLFTKKTKTMYTVQSISDEGVYYLVNGWQKHKQFWAKIGELKESMLYSRKQDAKASLTKLLKQMEEYADDILTIVEVNV